MVVTTSSDRPRAPRRVMPSPNCGGPSPRTGCSAAFCGERERGTWESLLTTPLQPYDYVDEQHRAIAQRIQVFCGCMLLPLAVLGIRLFLDESINDPFLPAALLLIGWNVAWAAAPSMAACGLRCSAKASALWRCLFATIGSVILRLLIIVGLAYFPVLVVFEPYRSNAGGNLLRIFLLLLGGGAYGYLVRLALHDESEKDLRIAQRTLLLLAKHRLELDTDPPPKRRSKEPSSP